MNTLHKRAIAIAGCLTLFTAAQAAEQNVYNGEDSGSVYLSRQPWTSTRTRAEVVTELKAAQGRGEISAMNGEDSGSAYLASRGGRAASPVIVAGPKSAGR